MCVCTRVCDQDKNSADWCLFQIVRFWAGDILRFSPSGTLRCVPTICHPSVSCNQIFDQSPFKLPSTSDTTNYFLSVYVCQHLQHALLYWGASAVKLQSTSGTVPLCWGLTFCCNLTLLPSIHICNPRLKQKIASRAWRHLCNTEGKQAEWTVSGDTWREFLMVLPNVKLHLPGVKCSCYITSHVVKWTWGNVWLREPNSQLSSPPWGSDIFSVYVQKGNRSEKLEFGHLIGEILFLRFLTKNTEEKIACFL